MLDYHKDQLGVQGSHAGALLIEGNWYCPAMPQALIDATRDYRNGTIKEPAWRERIAARGNYLLRAKERPDAEGHQRNTCAAAGHAPTVRCSNKPVSIGRTTSANHRVHPDLAIVNNPPQICVQQTATFPPEAGAKLVQTLRFGTPEWAAVYHTLRNTIEGINGIAKDGAHSALGDPSRRRIRGVAAQTIFTALLLLGDNLRMIRSFLAHAVPDETGTKRRPRRRRRKTNSIQKHRPSLAPSGVPPP